MAKRQLDEHESLQPGWAQDREPLEEKRVPSLTAGAGHDKWAARATQHSGPKFAPGLSQSKSS
jgi:hypothetical protein